MMDLESPLMSDRLDLLRRSVPDRKVLADALLTSSSSPKGFDDATCARLLGILFNVDPEPLQPFAKQGGLFELVSELLGVDCLAEVASATSAVVSHPQAANEASCASTALPSSPNSGTNLRLPRISDEWRSATLAVGDLVMLAPGVPSSEILRTGDIGQILCDNRSSSNPLQVRGPRGRAAWFRCESLVPYGHDISHLVCSKGHLLMQYRGRVLAVLDPACCRLCGVCIPLNKPRWRCDSSKECLEYSVCGACLRQGEQSVVQLVQEQNQEPLIQQVVRALNPEVHVNFPMLTDICEAAARKPENSDVALTVLVATLGEQALKPGDTRNITQDYLKVLTIFNEMTYDDQVTEVLRHTPGLQLALERLRQFRSGELGSEADENIRMLATEVEKAVFQIANGEGLRAGAPCSRLEIVVKCPSGHPLEWKGGTSRFHTHNRSCSACARELLRTMERYTCRTCDRYDLCTACLRRGGVG